MTEPTWATPDTSQTPLQQSLQQAAATTRFIEHMLAKQAAEPEPEAG